MGDPYWYEWSVGEQQIINMLNEDNNIEYVELQANVGLGLDDVVVTYSDGRVLCIQVKHTRANDTLTFADLVYSAKKTSKSLLAELADSWQEESRKYTEVVPQVFTNRRKGQVSSSTKGEEKFVRPALDVFWKKLSEKIKFAKNFEDIIFEEYPEAWNEWKTQLSGIQSNDDKLKFLRLLQLETEQKDLQEIENEVLSHLSIAFRITLDDADKLLGKLDHALRKWTTSVRNTSRIYVEDVYEALSIDDYISPYNHELIPAEPFFDSRKDFVEEIEKELLFGNEKVLFLSGIPGTGKTNIVSKLCNKRDSIIKIRYYAYEPIQPDKEYLPMDVSERVKKEHLAAIFAVYEASQCADAMELERKLSDRKLSGNIEEYYSNIWNDAVGTLKQYDFVDYKLAGVFAFLNERVDGQMLAEIFNELDIPVVAWNNVLKTLKPLIVEESGKYHVLHNDVKVFLSNIVNIDDEHTREIGNSLTDYYLYKEDKSQAYYFDIVRLMSMAKREAEIVDVFSGKFVIEAFRIVQTEGSRQVTRDTKHYSLQMIIAVGFKVNSERAVQFRKWVSQIAKNDTIKGWVMDDERLKRGAYLTEKYFDKQLERIREIRASERKFYQKITDLYATAIDYDKEVCG